MSKKMSINDAWSEIIDEHNIISKLKKENLFHISAKEIKKYKEPRNMAKWDSSESLPVIFKQNDINILPTSRSSYVLGNFELYEKLPEFEKSKQQIKRVSIQKNYESIDIDNITSEANAINVLMLSNILDDFSGEKNVSTFNGRMGTNEFDFKVNSKNGFNKINVNKAQCEIDGGFENNNSVVILEAKNVIHPDFHIRQLYYPYRLWSSKVRKPIRLVFSVYSNKIYRLFEYEFLDIENYSSIALINQKYYSLEDTDISLSDLVDVRNELRDNPLEIVSDTMPTAIPFVQADSFDKVISLMESLSEQNLTKMEIADIMQFDQRQSDYYYNAGKYLGIFEKENDLNNGGKVVKLTSLGKQIYDLDFKPRQLALVRLILKHKVFFDLFDYSLRQTTLPSQELIIQKMKELNVCSDNLLQRRASSVRSWLQWIFFLPNLSK